MSDGDIVYVSILDEIQTTIRQFRHVTSPNGFVHTIGPQYLHLGRALAGLLHFAI